MVMVLFSASLLGLFEIRLPSGASTFLATRGGNGLAGHFWQGAFATLLATPCTAPFRVRRSRSRWRRRFRCGDLPAMGIGMSLPWLLVAAPGLLVAAAGAGPALAASGTLDERRTRSAGDNDARLIAVAAEPADGAHWQPARHHAGRAPDPYAAAGHRPRYRWQTALRAGVLAVVGRSSRVCIRLRRRGSRRDRIHWQPLSEQAIARALAENNGVRRRDRRLVRDL